jgi:hypothetical protein
VTWIEAVNELVVALVWFGLGFGVRAVLSSPFGAGRWPGGEAG